MPFIPFTEEQKRQANNTDLVSFLQMRGEKLKRAGREYKLIYSDETGQHDSITISGSTWFDHKAQEGGGAVKFMQRFYGMSFPEAMQALLGYSVEPVQHITRQASKPEPKKEFVLPEAHSNMHRVYAYLIKQRFIAPEIITHFAKAHTLYEDAKYHNAVFVGLDENGTPQQAHKRSTITFGTGFKMTVEGSDTRYSFAHFGTSGRLFVFEAPIDMLSFLTLYPENWQEHSYITMNGVYENAMLQALKTHPDLQEIVLCTDNDEGGIDAAYRFRDILREHGYTSVKRFAPPLKDWNEVLKARNGVDFLPAVPHKRLDAYLTAAGALQEYRFVPERAANLLRKSAQNKTYYTLAGFALAGSAFFLQQAGCAVSFQSLQRKLQAEYKPYADKGNQAARQRHFSDAMRRAVAEIRRPARTREQSVQTAKVLFDLADCAVRLKVDDVLAQEQSEELTEAPGMAYG